MHQGLIWPHSVPMRLSLHSGWSHGVILLLRAAL